MHGVYTGRPRAHPLTYKCLIRNLKWWFQHQLSKCRVPRFQPKLKESEQKKKEKEYERGEIKHRHYNIRAIKYARVLDIFVQPLIHFFSPTFSSFRFSCFFFSLLSYYFHTQNNSYWFLFQLLLLIPLHGSLSLYKSTLYCARHLYKSVCRFHFSNA